MRPAFPSLPPRSPLPLLALALLASCQARPILQEASVPECARCHGAPPDTGAHRLHATPPDPFALSYGTLAILEDVSPSGGPGYAFGCGHCHPLDEARHQDGAVQVDLVPPATPVAGDQIKGLNLAGAAWDPGDGSCSGVYCHSSGQEAPAFVATPAWSAAPGALGCDGCHGDPPRYASGGPGAADANSHIGFDPYGMEWGHFAGMPGPSHGSKHGGDNALYADSPQAASPITCQACHAETVDPASAMPGGFFWLDTGAPQAYQLPGGEPARFGYAPWQHGQCATCHGDGGAPAGTGAVMPLRHVNGRRDVAFDRRRSLPAGYATGLPAFADADPDPTVEVRPYYVSGVAASFASSAPPGAVVRATVGEPVYTTTLESATYDAGTKTCSNVGCHVARQAQVDLGAMPPLRWGAGYAGFEACSGCHPF